MATAAKTDTSGGGHKQVQMGVGDAIQRLIHVEMRYRNGLAGQEALDEREMIAEALNQFQLDIGFDCDNDGVPDTVEIFEASAATSCCRIMSTDTSRRYAGKAGSTRKTKKPTLRRSSTSEATVQAPDAAVRKVKVAKPKHDASPPLPAAPPPIPDPPKKRVVRRVPASSSRRTPTKPKK